MRTASVNNILRDSIFLYCHSSDINECSLQPQFGSASGSGFGFSSVANTSSDESGVSGSYGLVAATGSPSVDSGRSSGASSSGSGSGSSSGEGSSVLTSPCSEFAECSNLIGSFSCSCISGYTGDGFQCSRKFYSIP